MPRLTVFAFLPLLLLGACDNADEGTTVTTAQNAQSGEAETVIAADNGWRLVASQSAGATAVYTPAGATDGVIAIACPIRNLIEVSLAGAQPLPNDEKLAISFGTGTPIALNAVTTMDRTGEDSVIKGAMKAAGPAPQDLGDMMQIGVIAATYGAKNYGPFPAFPDNVRQRMINEC